MRRRYTWQELRLAVPVVGLSLWACISPPVETPSTVVVQQTNVRVDQNIKNKVDVLFVIDNSPSMTPKQTELKLRFPQLIKVLDDFAGKGNPAHYHIGVVTSDLGAGTCQTATGPQPCVLGMGQCHAGGDGAKLQPIGAKAPLTCTRLGGNVNYIDYDQIMNKSNLPSGTASAMELQTAFSCASTVGDAGCGFEMQLEAGYKALHDNIPENQGFLREDAILAVVYVTDEDDCSADPSTDLFDPSQTQYNSLLSYRCTQFGIECGGTNVPYADSGGALAMCAPATGANTKLTEVQKYINFFTQPKLSGGVKVDPQDVIVAAISAPSSPVQIVVGDPRQIEGYYPNCAAGQAIDAKTCAVLLQHSCVSPNNAKFFGDPAVRINTVVAASRNNQQASICADDYTDAITKLGELIVSNIGAGCITSPLTNPDDPDCVVEDITANSDGSTTIRSIDACSDNSNTAPCWKLYVPVDKTGAPTCKPVFAPGSTTAQQYGITVDRGTAGAPPNTLARVSCATIATGG